MKLLSISCTTGSTAWAYLEGAAGAAPPPIEEIFAPV